MGRLIRGVVGDLSGAARSRANGMATLHVLALASVVVLALAHVLDGPAVMAGFGMILHGFREAHRKGNDDGSNGTGSGSREGASDEADVPPRATIAPPSSARRVLSWLDGVRLGLARLAWVSLVLALVGLSSCVSTNTLPQSNAPDLLLKTRAALRAVCGVATRAADEAVKLFDDLEPSAPPAHDGARDAGDGGGVLGGDAGLDVEPDRG